MKKTILSSITLALFTMVSTSAMANDGIDAEKIYSKNCKTCHKFTGKKFGPGFKEMSSDAAVLLATITDGRKAMPKFNKKLSSDEIHAMVSFIQAQQK